MDWGRGVEGREGSSKGVENTRGEGRENTRGKNQVNTREKKKGEYSGERENTRRKREG
jgi:hypothetical protein